MQGSKIVVNFTARGGWWVVAQLPLLVLAFWVPHRTGRAWPHLVPDAATGAGLLLIAIGVVMVAMAIRTLGPALTPFPRPLEYTMLRTGGIYALVRHPIYCGLLAVAWGWSLYLHSAWGIAFDVLLFAFFDRKAAREERWLAERFPEYPAYRQRVKKLIPGLY